MKSTDGTTGKSSKTYSAKELVNHETESKLTLKKRKRLPPGFLPESQGKSLFLETRQLLLEVLNRHMSHGPLYRKEYFEENDKV